MPVLDQSVARHVVLSISKVIIPSLTASMMTSLDFSNASWSSSVQLNSVDGLRRSRKGFITSVMEKA